MKMKVRQVEPSSLPASVRKTLEARNRLLSQTRTAKAVFSDTNDTATEPSV